ncbi:hypothetical protein KI387_000096, partial [Taxus chinensis]
LLNMAALASTMITTHAHGGINCTGAIQRNYLGAGVPHRSMHVKCMAQTSTKLGDVFSFAGAAPETINGRLAMVGFVSAIGVEVASGRDLFSQLSSGTGVSWFLLSTLLFSAASLVPMLKGVTAQSKSQDIMSSSAEIWNGRFAMLGLLALAFTEYVKGGPL